METLLKGQWAEDNLSAVAGGGKRLRRLDGDALDKALFDEHITPDQHCTLEDFRGQLFKAGLVFTPRAGMEVSGTSGQGQFLADACFSRAKRVQSKMEILANMGSDKLNYLIDVLTMDLIVTKDGAVVLKESAKLLDEQRK